jgi:hypothetical protein
MAGETAREELEDLFAGEKVHKIGGRSFTLKRLRIEELPEAIRLVELAFGEMGVALGDEVELMGNLSEANLAALRALLTMLCKAEEEALRMPVKPFFLLLFAALEFNRDFFYPKLAAMGKAKASAGPSSSSGSEAQAIPAPSDTP